MGVSSTLIADPPGLGVFPSMTNRKSGSAVTVLDPTVITGRGTGFSEESSGLG